MLKSLLTQLAGKHVHDALVNSPLFHKIVRKAHDTVKGITPPHEGGPHDPNSLAVTRKVKKFVDIYREELVDNFRRRK